MTLFLDLDGTVLNVKARSLAVYHAVATTQSLPLISDKEYLERKRNKLLPIDEISDQQAKKYRTAFKNLSEMPSMLTMDSIVTGVLPLIKQLKRSYSLIIVTNRHNRIHLLNQLQALQLDAIFNKVITPYPGKKSEAIKTSGFTSEDTVIGDTEEDIIAATELGISSIAVTWGERSREYLQQFSPTHMVDTVKEIETLL